jgi:hypothetical protein
MLQSGRMNLGETDLWKSKSFTRNRRQDSATVTAVQRTFKMSLDVKLAKIRSPNLESQKHVSFVLASFLHRLRLTITDCRYSLINRGHTPRAEYEEHAHGVFCSAASTP